MPEQDDGSTLVAASRTALPSQCFVAYADAGYLPLANVLVRGLGRFSRRPIVLYGINTAIDFDAPNLITRHMTWPSDRIFFAKLAVIEDSLRAGVERGVYLDADTVPNRGIDRLFDEADRARRYPLLFRHPRQLAELDETWRTTIAQLMTHLGVERPTMPFVQAGCHLFTPSTRRFYEAATRIARDLRSRSRLRTICDERLVNVLLWQQDATRQLDPCCLYWRYLDAYLDGSLESLPAFMRDHGDRPYHAYSFASCKDAVLADRLLDKLIDRDRGASGQAQRGP